MSIWRPVDVKIYIFLAVAIVQLSLCSKVVKAEELPINLEQAIQMALQHDYEVKSDQNDLKKANLVVKEKIIGALPQIQVEAEKKQYLSTDNSFRNASLIVTETIPTGFQLYGKRTASDLEMSKWDQGIAQDEYRISRAEVIYNTVVLYLNALKAERLVDYQETAVKNAQAEAEYANTQLNLGKITKVAQLTAENDLAKARYQLESNRQDYIVALKKLARQTGVKDYRLLRLDQTVPRTVIEVTDYERLKTTALNKRLELHQTRIAVQKAEQELAEAINTELPVLSLAYQNRSAKESYSLEYDFLNAEFSWTTAWQQNYLDDITSSDSDDVFGSFKKQYQLKLSWGLDLGGAKNRIQQATYTLKNAKLDHLQSAQDIIAEVDEALSAYELANSKIALAQQALTLYQKDAELKKLQLQLGKATYFEVAEADLNLMSAGIELDNAYCDLRIAAEKLRLKLGELYD